MRCQICGILGLLHDSAFLGVVLGVEIHEEGRVFALLKYREIREEVCVLKRSRDDVNVYGPLGLMLLLLFLANIFRSAADEANKFGSRFLTEMVTGCMPSELLIPPSQSQRDNSIKTYSEQFISSP